MVTLRTDGVFLKRTCSKNKPIYFIPQHSSSPQKKRGDTRLPIPPRVMSSAMGPNLGVFGFLPTIQAKAKAKQMHSRSLRAARFLVGLFSRSARSTCNQLTHLMNHDYFYYGGKREDPQTESHTGIKMAQGLVSPSSISVNHDVAFSLVNKPSDSNF